MCEYMLDLDISVRIMFPAFKEFTWKSEFFDILKCALSIFIIRTQHWTVLVDSSVLLSDSPARVCQMTPGDRVSVCWGMSEISAARQKRL